MLLFAIFAIIILSFEFIILSFIIICYYYECYFCYYYFAINAITYVINDLNGEEIIGSFYEKKLQKINQKEFRIEKILNKKGNKLYVKWKDYDNSFNS